MTLILGAACSDGAVIVSDGIMSQSRGLTRPLEKLYRLRDLPIAYGLAGPMGPIHEVVRALSKCRPKKTIAEQFEEIGGCFYSAIRKQVQRVHSPQPRTDYTSNTSMVVVGVTQGEPWLMCADDRGHHFLVEQRMGAFFAVGVGQNIVMSIADPYLMQPRNTRKGKVMLLRIMEDAIRLSVQKLANPIHLWSIDLQGSLYKSDHDDLALLSRQCDEWRTLAARSLDQVLSEAKAG